MKKILYLSENEGLYVKGFKDKESAVKAMREDAEHEKSLDEGFWNEIYKFQPEDITMESVIETRYYQHRFCETESIGDDGMCYSCGEPCGTGGRWTYAYFAK